MMRPTPTPRVLIFDVNETLLDIEALAPVFEEIYSDPASLREWFAQLVLYSMTLTVSQQYVDFVTLGRAVAQMLAVLRLEGLSGMHPLPAGESIENRTSA